MCGGEYKHWDVPKHLLPINGEPVVARTIKLLREAGVDEIYISSNDERFEHFGVPVLHHTNMYKASEQGYNNHWVDAFYPTDEPTTYIFGDVVFSPEAIKTIINTPTEDIEFFGSAPPFSPMYSKPWAEPFALKVVDTDHLKWAIEEVYRLTLFGKFKRMPIMWELWQVIKDTPLNVIDYTNYTHINDYTCDIDYKKDIPVFEKLLGGEANTDVRYMIHTMPKRLWYVEEFLLPSMIEQGINPDNIKVFNDTEKLGNLMACMKSFESVEGDGGTWHIQDDVLLSRDFKQKTEQFNSGIVCGFKSYYDNDKQGGVVELKDMWWSFPCIRIPNDIARDCAQWTQNYIIGNPIYREWWERGQSDDKIFRQFVFDNYKKQRAINLDPNIVEHVDYLIGGTVTSSKRKVKLCRSECWNDEDLVKELTIKLRKTGHLM